MIGKALSLFCNAVPTGRSGLPDGAKNSRSKAFLLSQSLIFFACFAEESPQDEAWEQTEKGAWTLRT
jgi:hypothetical protein